MDNKSRVFVNDALSSVFTFHRSQDNTHDFEVTECISRSLHLCYRPS